MAGYYLSLAIGIVFGLGRRASYRLLTFLLCLRQEVRRNNLPVDSIIGAVYRTCTM